MRYMYIAVCLVGLPEVIDGPAFISAPNGRWESSAQRNQGRQGSGRAGLSPAAMGHMCTSHRSDLRLEVSPFSLDTSLV